MVCLLERIDPSVTSSEKTSRGLKQTKGREETSLFVTMALLRDTGQASPWSGRPPRKLAADPGLGLRRHSKSWLENWGHPGQRPGSTGDLGLKKQLNSKWTCVNHVLLGLRGVATLPGCGNEQAVAENPEGAGKN